MTMDERPKRFIGQPGMDPAQDDGSVQLDLGFSDRHEEEAVPHSGLWDVAAVLDLLDDWHAAGWLQQLDLRFARFLHAERPDVPGLLLLAAALASHQLGRGHVCLDLAATLRGPGQVLNLPPEFRFQSSEAGLIAPAELLRDLSLRAWESALDSRVVSDGGAVAPLVYDGGRLYLYRYWRYEQQVAHGIASRLRPCLNVERNAGLDEPGSAARRVPSEDRVRAIIDVLFGGPPDEGAAIDWQRLACALAAQQRFSIVTGGPGTGKTTTVVRLLALLQALHHEGTAAGRAGSGPSVERVSESASDHPDMPWLPLRIQLAAPTGKAAARLSESIAGKVGELPLEQLPGGAVLTAAIPVQVTTLHRLLGGRPHVQSRRYHAGNPLPLDVLVIDEASMVSLSDMAHVMAALPAQAQLILIGDKDQLSSVEAGSVLGELCRRAEGGHYLPSTARWLERAAGVSVPQAVVDPAGNALDQAVAMLRVSHRFGEHSGIGKLAFSVNAGRVDEAQALLDAPPSDLAHVRVDSVQDADFGRLIADGSTGASDVSAASSQVRRCGYGHYLGEVAHEPDSEDPRVFDEWAAEVLRAQRACQLLCVLRSGPWGVDGLNAAIARILHRRGLISSLSGWYAGRPVMVTRNNPALRLTNGDIGVVLPYPVAGLPDKALRVAFPDNDGAGVRWFAPNRLDDVETVYALTVHKSQGSEFHHAMLVLPPAPTPVLTRELLYTGITRASSWFTLVNPGGAGLLRQAIRQRIYRSGGLSDVLEALR